jgi:hypothetical protein
MSGDWVNRIGIILNFCAGFLLAPELIGIQRLQRFETFLEEGLTSVRDLVGYLVEILSTRRIVLGRYANLAKGRTVLQLERGRTLVYSLGSLVLWGIFLLAMFKWFDFSVRVTAATAVSLVATTLVALVAISVLSLVVLSLALHRTLRIIWLISFGIVLIPLGILATVCYGLVRVSAPLLSSVLGIVIARLMGSDRLRGIVVTLGIALFIVGNTLQLLATWL